MANIAHQILMSKFVSIAGSAGIPVVSDTWASIFAGSAGIPVVSDTWASIFAGYGKYRYTGYVGNVMNKALGKHYYKHLGHGFFSAVYSEPEDNSVVYKVGFKKDDSGAAYAAFCRNNQGRVGIPVIHNIEMLSTGQYVVMMDRLQSNNELTRVIRDVIYEINKIVCGHFKTVDVSGAGEDWVGKMVMEFMNNLATAWSTREPDRDGDCLVDNFLVLHKDDFEAIERFLSAETIEYMVEYAVTAYRIHMFFRGLASFDMHDGNWMINDAGLPIIIDPVSFSRVASDEE